MSPGEILSVLGGTGGGTAVAFCIFFMLGWIVPKATHEDMRNQRDEWKRIAELNAARAEAGVVAGHIVKDVMTGLRKELE